MTLHNQALLNMDSKATEGFEKLAFLLQQPSFPPVTFGNLLLLYCKHEVGRPARRRDVLNVDGPALNSPRVCHPE